MQNTDNNLKPSLDNVRILIENWPRLQCVNVVLIFESAADVQHTDLNLTPTHLEVSLTNHPSTTRRFTFPPSLCVNVEAISQLVKDTNYLSFRLATNRAHAFDEEYLCQMLPNARINSPARMKLKPSVAPDERVVLICTMCGHSLSSSIAFERVLELPSDNIDSEEWFCHHPTKGHHSHGGPQQELYNEMADDSDYNNPMSRLNFTKMNARPLDLLYGQFFFVVSSDLLGGIQLVRDVVKCPQCHRDLGDYHRKNETLQLWNELVSFRSTGTSEKCPVTKPLFAGTLFDQFLFIVRKTVEDFDFLWTTEALPQTIRCLFETQRRSNIGRCRTFLLVNVMARDLEMWVLLLNSNTRESTPKELNDFEKINGMKILFQVVETDGQIDSESSIVVNWRNDPTVNHIHISSAMMVDAIFGIEELVRMMSPCYRRAFGAGFRTSYLYGTDVTKHLKLDNKIIE